MNKFESLNKIIKQTLQEFEEEIVEITNLKQLYEMASVGMVAGYSVRQDQQKNEGIKKMISRKDIITEKLMRQYIRKKIQENLSNKDKNLLKEEDALRRVIRKLISEGDISDVHPHRSTGINMLEDVLKKAIPTLRMDFKRLTTDKSQRDSFRSHILKAVMDSLAPMRANDQYLQGNIGGSASALLDEPLSDITEEEIPELEEAEIEIDIEDEDKKIPIEDDDKPTEEEEFGTGLEGQDETGRNMAFTSYKKVSQYILDAYDSLANPKDKEIFTEYLVTNLKLYFDKFEDELQNTVEEPDTASYSAAAQ